MYTLLYCTVLYFIHTLLRPTTHGGVYIPSPKKHKLLELNITGLLGDSMKESPYNPVMLNY